MEISNHFFRDTWVEIQLDYLEENIRSIIKHVGNQSHFLAVVKANAYGHGDIQVAKTALQAGADGLAVAFLDEALSLRNGGIHAPILVLGASRPKDAKIAADHQVSLTVFQKEWLTEAASFLNDDDILNIHIKCDTGMGRIGVKTGQQLEEVVNIVESTDCYRFEGIFTHFATADELDTHYFELQLQRFYNMLDRLKKKPPYIHVANSATAIRFPQNECNMIRMGIAMYGLSPSIDMKDLIPFPLKEVFSLHTRLTHVKRVHAGESVSYGATYTAKETEWIGTLPIGYGDGWIRKLQGQDVIVNGERVPIVGRICMDQCMVKLPYYMAPGTKVTLIGSQGHTTITIDEIARKLETINYEVPCIISSRVPRVYIRKAKPINVSNKLIQPQTLSNF